MPRFDYAHRDDDFQIRTVPPGRVTLTLLLQSPIFCKKVYTHMSGAQSYIVRVLRKVETWLSDHSHSTEASRVGKLIQKLAQADDMHEALSALYRVEQFDQFALRLMWLMEAAERGDAGLENGMMEYQATVLGDLVVNAFKTDSAAREIAGPRMLPDQIDNLYVSLHKFGRGVEELKRGSLEGGIFKGIQENRLYRILNELASLKEAAVAAGKEQVIHFGDACSEFIQYVLDNGLLNDVRIVNVLDNANITLQTVFEAAGIEDNDSLLSTIQLLKRPQDLLN